MQDEKICCPNCHAPLTIDTGSETEQFCPTCNGKYEVHNGIIDFTPDEHFYWGEISQPDMKALNEQARQVGWNKAYLDTTTTAARREMRGYLFNPVRIAGMFHFYNPEKSDAVLDLGSGFGPISFGLSKFYKNVYSVDGVYERLCFQSIRAEQEQVQNIKIIKGTMLRLPFYDNSMDTVIVNGLLEWIGLSDDHTDPRQLQKQFLGEVYRVLKPDGKIFIGIENRTGAQFLIGGIDHSGLRFTSLMPRWLASQVVRRSRRHDKASVFEGAKKAYRTLTYTFWGYKKLLRKMGFRNTDIYWTYPSYNQPQVSGTPDGVSGKYYLKALQNQTKSPWKRAAFYTAALIPRPVFGVLMRAFAPYFLIVASKEQPVKGLQDLILGVKPASSFLRATSNKSPDLDTAFATFKNGHLDKTIRTSTEEIHQEGA